MKKMICSIIAIIMLFACFPLEIYASDLLEEEYIDEENEYLTDVILVENGIARQITQTEYDSIMADAITEADNSFIDMSSLDDIPAITPRVTTYYYIYNQTSSSTTLDRTKTKAISPWIYGNEDGSTIGYTQTTSETFTGSVSAQLDSLGKSTVLSKIKITGTASWSTTNSRTLTQTMTVGPYKEARIIFTPYVITSKGTLEYWSQPDWSLYATLLSSQSITAYAIKTVGSYADGLYQLEYK